MGKLALILSGRLFSTLQNFLVTALVIRTASDADSAAYLYCFVIGNLVQFFGLASLEPLIMKKVHEAPNPDAVDLSSYVYAALALCFGPYVLALIYFSLQSGERPLALDYFLFTTIWTLTTTLQIPSPFLRARLNMAQEVSTFLTVASVALIAKVGVILLGLAPKYLFLVMAAECATCAIAWRGLSACKQATFFALPRWSEVWAVVRAGIPYVVAVGLGNIYVRSAFVMFSPVLSDAELVAVGVIGQLVTAGGLIAYTLVQNAYPIQQRYADDDARFRQILIALFGFCVIWGLAVSVGLLLLGDWFVGLVFNKTGLIPLVAFGLIGVHLALQTMVNVRNNAVLIKGTPKDILILNAVGLVLALAYSYALTPLADTTGFVLALVAAAAAGLGAGFASPAARQYGKEIWACAAPGRLIPAMKALYDDFKR